MTTGPDEVLVGPLRPDARRGDLLARLDLLPAGQRDVLSSSYLEGLAPDDVAERCSLTVRELALVRGDALRALKRSRRQTRR